MSPLVARPCFTAKPKALKAGSSLPSSPQNSKR
jgi:hypothetical protein